MTIQIFNSTPDFNIYPVLAAGTPSKFDQWMEGCFRVKAQDIPIDNNLSREPPNTVCTSIAAALTRAAIHSSRRTAFPPGVRSP